MVSSRGLISFFVVFFYNKRNVFIPGVPADPGCVLNFLHDVNARQEQIRSDGINPGPICVVSIISFLTIFLKKREREIINK